MVHIPYLLRHQPSSKLLPYVRLRRIVCPQRLSTHSAKYGRYYIRRLPFTDQPGETHPVPPRSAPLRAAKSVKSPSEGMEWREGNEEASGGFLVDGGFFFFPPPRFVIQVGISSSSFFSGALFRGRTTIYCHLYYTTSVYYTTCIQSRHHILLLSYPL